MELRDVSNDPPHHHHQESQVNNTMFFAYARRSPFGAVCVYVLAELNSVLAGEREQTSIEALIADLPQLWLA